MSSKKSAHDTQASLFLDMDTPTIPTETTSATPPLAPVEAPAVETPPVPAAKIKAPAKSPAQSRQQSLEVMYRSLVEGVRHYFRSHNLHKGVVGISGGVDSSLTLKIAVDALGRENVTGILMPEHGLTSQDNISHGKLLCEFFGVQSFVQPINTYITDFNIAPWRPNDRAQMNTKARIRTVLLYSFANTANALVLGTSNRSELLLGYGTKYGDLAADLEVIGELYKTEVFKIADHVGLPSEIVNKAPSAELAPGQTDEEELGATYEDLDKILAKIDMGKEACIEYGFPPALVHLVYRRYEENRHKLQMPEMIHVKRSTPHE